MKTRFFSVLALTAFMFTACGNDDDNTDQVNDGRVKFTSGITATPQTKVATDNAGNSIWNINDPIGIYMVDNGTTTIVESAENIPYKATTASASTSFAASGTDVIRYPTDIPTKVDFIAYHPYNSSVTNWVYPIVLWNQTSQTAIDLMHATADNLGAGYDKTSSNVNFTFSHQLVKLILNVRMDEGIEDTVTDVKISGMSTSAKFDLTGKAGITDIEASNRSITPHTVNFGTKYEAILLPVANVGIPHFVRFYTSGGDLYLWSMSDDITSLEAGNIYTYDITMKRSKIKSTGNITRWSDYSGTGSVK